MLHWIDTRDAPLPWSTGSAEARLDVEVPTGALPVAIRCRFGALEFEELAMLDTGAHYSLIGGELFQLLRGELGPALEPISMSTRLGRFSGTTHRLPIHLVADQGKDLTIDATCVALPDWEGPSILGFKGFLNRFRFALEPEDTSSPARLHFGRMR